MEYLELIHRIRRLRAVRKRYELYRANLRRRMLRDASDPFAVPENTFRGHYRLPRDLARHLVDQVEPYLRSAQRRSAIPVHIKVGLLQRSCVLYNLQFYAQGCHQRPNGAHFDLAMSQPSVSRCIEEVTTVLNEHFFRVHVKFPGTLEERRAVILKNYQNEKLPGVIGYIDGSHVAIKGPPSREELFVNRKGYHSLNVQVVCDSDLLLLNVLARFPGSSHDNFIWNGCNLRQTIMGVFRSGEKCWLLGDSGYREEPWLHIPDPNAVEDSLEEAYNLRHKKSRTLVERCLGILKARFRCLLASHSMELLPQKACKIINACSVLHNMCVRARLPDPEIDQEVVEEERLLLNRLRRRITEENVAGNDEQLNEGPNRPVRERNPLLVEGEKIGRDYLVQSIAWSPA